MTHHYNEQENSDSPRYHLLTIPFAGGNAYSYNSFLAMLPGNIVMIPLELSGRGRRLNEPLCDDLNAMARDLFEQCRDELATFERYVIYGHSMGALLAYLLAHLIVAAQIKPPVCLIVSGRVGPAWSFPHNENIYQLSKAAFLAKVRALGGTPEEVIRNKPLWDFFEPVLRNDFKAVEDYSYVEQTVLPIPVKVFFGEDEGYSDEQIALWQKESVYPVEVRNFPGNHFFIFKEAGTIVRIFISILLKTETV